MMPVTAKHAATPSAPPDRGTAASRPSFLSKAAPYLLALFFFASALYRVNQTDIVDTDAARHAMNGVFLYDLVRTGRLAHPIEYAKVYYSHLPSLSMPFHPPLFPAIEALFFAVFGVNLLAARFAVAVAVAISVILLYRLTLATIGHRVVSASIVLTVFSLWTLQFVARDVMLEYPALVFTLAALYCLRDFPDSYPMRRAIPFAIFAASAVWTKQHTVFLGAVPFVQIVLSRRWRSLLQIPLWISSALFGGAVIAFIRFSQLFHGAGANLMSTSTRDVYYIFTSTLPSYFRWFTEGLVGPPGILLVCSAGIYFAARRRGAKGLSLSLYFAWAIACLAVLIDLGPISKRYLFFVFPAITVIGFAWLYHGCRWFWGERRAGGAVLVVAATFVATGLAIPFDFLQGPGAAAHIVVKGAPTRVLYAGDGDGNFIFEVRVLDPKLDVSVIPSIKLSHTQLALGVTEICRRYGIEWVVLENGPHQRPWSAFREELAKNATLEQSVPLRSTRARWRSGTVDVYRFANVPHPDGVLQIPVPKINEEIPARL
jgi:hypothetical protein